jgi:hypothetical protein
MVVYCASRRESILSLRGPYSKEKFKSRLRLGVQLGLRVSERWWCLRGLVRGATALGERGHSSDDASSGMTSLWYPESSASESVVGEGGVTGLSLSSFVVPVSGLPLPRSATPPLLANHRCPLQSSHGLLVSTACSCCLTFQQGVIPARLDRVASMQCCQIAMV